MCVCELGDLWIESPAHWFLGVLPLSGPVVGEQEVLVFAGEAEFEVPERAAGGVERPDAHQEQDDVGGDQAGDVFGVLEGLQEEDEKRKSTQHTKKNTRSSPRPFTASDTHQTGNDEVADDDGSHRPPALLLAGVEEDDAPEHVKQDDGHRHEG